MVGDVVLARHDVDRLASRARPTLRIVPVRGIENGDRLGFAGRIPGPECRRRVVKLQAKVGPHRWQVFRTDRTGTGCRFSAHYELRATTQTTRYRFRALVPEQGDYPYERGHSAVVTRRVTARSPTVRRPALGLPVRTEEDTERVLGQLTRRRWTWRSPS